MSMDRGREFQTGLIASMTALAIILHIFRLPFPLAVFLKYDLAGVPLLILAMLTSLNKAVVGTIVFSIGVFILGGDPVGALMKGLAEFSSITGFVVAYKKYMDKKFGKILVVSISAMSRTILMTIANVVVTPFWLMYFAKACGDYTMCLNITLMYIPVIALFNVSLGVVVASIALAFEKYVLRIAMGWKTVSKQLK